MKAKESLQNQDIWFYNDSCFVDFYLLSFLKTRKFNLILIENVS